MLSGFDDKEELKCWNSSENVKFLLRILAHGNETALFVIVLAVDRGVDRG